MKCRECGFENLPDNRFCEQCGAPLTSSKKTARPAKRNETEVISTPLEAPSINSRICPNCGNLTEEGAYFCGNCGYVLSSDAFMPYPGSDVEEEDDNSMAKTVLIGVGIGIAVLAIAFIFIYFIRGGGDEGDVEETTAPTTAYEEYETTSPSGEGDSAYGYDDRNYGGGDYSSYATEEQLYQSGAPLILPESSQTYLDEGDLYGLNEDQVQKAINDIYARHGKAFKTSMIGNYYRQFEWYTPVSNDDETVRSTMNDMEKENIDTMRAYSKRFD